MEQQTQKLNKSNKSHMIVILLSVIVIIFLLWTGLTPYAKSGGFGGQGKDKNCECIGIPYIRNPPKNMADGFTLYYCIGFLYNCK
ncbi:MAG: hypothetical protein PHN31_04860 [Candidatus Gracilibacteria bacterium]|nr:hypothetical protein [Candidatus Gracilibacteria bacterium]